MVERKIGEVFKCATGDMVVCEICCPDASCRGCIYALGGYCSHDVLVGMCSAKWRKDGNSVVFRKISATTADKTLVDDINVLERIAVDYSGKTIDNIIVQLKSRLSETAHI